MCLDAHAHGLRIEHDIFNTPHKVKPSLENLATPSDYARFKLGETMPMWRVQTEGYRERRGQPIGVVSRDAGFLDSPDVEYISSGVNSKTPKAVALGRHGNFFHWGFAASPTYLTDEAKLVFINAVHYIARFDRQGIIARKKAGVIPRQSILDSLYWISDEGYSNIMAGHRSFARETAERKAALQAKVDRGEELSDRERAALARPNPKPPARFDRMRRYIPDAAWSKVKDDEGAITEYIKAQLPFMRPQGWYKIAIDQELKRFGIGSNDPNFLEKAVSALEKGGEGGKLARVLLGRYTEKSFVSPSEWRAWLTGNEGRFFFSEAAGYKWLVNPRAQKKSMAARSWSYKSKDSSR